MPEDFIIRAPIKVKPKLPNGRFHKLQITLEKFKISSWENFYGNQNSEALVDLTHENILEVQFNMPKVKSYQTYCKITFKDKAGKQDNLRFCILGSDAAPKNLLTEEVAELLGNLGDPRFANLDTPPQLDIPFDNPGNLRKFLYGLTVFSTVIVSSFPATRSVWWLGIGVFILLPSLITLGIDYVRVDTGWPIWAKLIAYICIFGLFFWLAMTIVFLLEYNGLI
ncbi:MAG: hypothetical protein R3D55_14040 [Chloroflexota bacterium]